MNRAADAPRLSDFEFQFDGDGLCLDFVNTWASRRSEASDKLLSPIAIVAFAQRSGLLDAAQAEDLARELRADSAAADRLLAQGRALRETLYHLFASRAAGSPMPEADVQALGREVERAYASPRLIVDQDRLELSFAQEDPSPDTLLAPIVRSAVELMTSERFDRLRECDGPTCNWLFIDHSRNRSRRWCSMRGCGNRAKARRHYRRHRDNGAE